MSTDYYATLGVSKTATPEEIKNAFRKLSLKHHPDKGGDPEVFKTINEANQVLSDPNKRKLYDAVGADGMKMYEGFQGENAEGLTGALGCLACLGCFLGPLLIIQLIFIPVSLENDVDWSAKTTLIPAFIMDGLLGLFVLTVSLTFLKASKEAEMGQKIVTYLLLFRILTVTALTIAFHVLLVQKVDDDDHTWKVVFAPMIAIYAYEVLSSLFKSFLAIQVYNRTAKDSDGQPMGFFAGLSVIISAIATNSLFLVFFVLIALKKDGDYDISWYSVVAPLWVQLGIGYVNTILTTTLQSEGSFLSAFCGTSFVLAPFFIFIGLVAAKSEGDDYTWHEVFAPVYAFLGLVCCGSCCLGTVLGGAKEDGAAQTATA